MKKMILLLAVAGCVPPPNGPQPGPNPTPTNYAEQAKEVAETASKEFRVLQSEVWLEASRRFEEGQSEREVGEWVEEAEKAAARAAFRPFRELLAEASEEGWTEEEAAEFFQAAAEGFNDLQ